MKKWVLMGIVLMLVLLSPACKVNYEAYVTIVNIGNLAMEGAVDGVWERIPPYAAVTWGIQLENKDEIVDVVAEARPVGGGDYESETIRLSGDRDIQTWLMGWDAAGSAGALQRKQSVVLSGTQDIGSLVRIYR